MTASDSTPSSGECVSDDTDLPDDFEQQLVEEVSECRQLLRETVGQDVDVRYVAVRIREVRARMEYLERQPPINQ